MRAVWFLVFSVASAYDDQSLMQQGLGVESATHASAGAVASQVEDMQAAIGGLSGLGPARQMALESMLAEAKSGAGIWTEIDTLLESILADMRADTVASQGKVNAHLAQYTAANDHNTHVVGNNVNTLETTYTTSLTNHETCRNQEATQFNVSSLNCFELVQSLGTLGTPQCVTPATHNLVATPGAGDISETHADWLAETGITEWNDWYSAITTWVNNAADANINNLVQLIDDCKTETAVLEAKIYECDGLQTLSESNFCSYQTANGLMCASRTTMWGTATTNHQAEWATEEALVADRVRFARMIFTIKCLCDGLGQTPQVIRTWDGDCAPPANFDDDYSITDITVPTWVDCPAVLGDPTTAAYHTTNYGSFAAPTSTSPAFSHTLSTAC